MQPFRAFRIHNDDHGYRAGVEELTLDNLTASEGDVLMRVRYSSVNYKDALAGTGRGKILRRFPLVGGIDAAGEVAESADPRFETGDQVLVTGHGLGVYQDGGYAEWIRVPADWVVPLPEGLTLFQSMALDTAGFTAGLALHRMEQNGQTPDMGPILVTGASGGVGAVSVRLFYSRGYEVVAVSGRPEHHAWLRELGASRVLGREGLTASTRPLEKATWGGAVDTVGGVVLAGILPSVVPQGNVASIGLAAGIEVHTTVTPFILRGISLLGIDSQDFPREGRGAVWDKLAGLAGDEWERLVTAEAPIARLSQTFRELLDSRLRGRCVVRL